MLVTGEGRDVRRLRVGSEATPWDDTSKELRRARAGAIRSSSNGQP